jgi:MYXO-CTERM domain-containing protein
MRLLLTTLGAALLALAWTGPTQAASYTLSTPNFSGYTGPFGTVTVTLEAGNTKADITFTGNSVGGFDFLFGDGGSVAVNTNGTATLVGTPTFTQDAGFNTASFTSGGAGNEDGFGSFGFSLNNNDGAASAATSVSFVIQKSSGTWTSDTNVLTANSQGETVAAHIFVFTSPAQKGNGALLTGYAADGPNATPEPSSLAIAGLGALGLFGYGLRRRRVK